MFAASKRAKARARGCAGPSGAGIAMRSDAGVSAARFFSGNSEPSASTMAGRSFRWRGTISQ